MRTLGQVVAWLVAKGAPVPQEIIQTTVSPTGNVILNHLLIFRAPGSNPDTAWYLLAAEGKVALFSADGTINDPGPTLLELRRRGIASGNADAPLADFTYPTDPPVFVIARRAGSISKSEMEG